MPLSVEELKACERIARELPPLTDAQVDALAEVVADMEGKYGSSNPVMTRR